MLRALHNRERIGSTHGHIYAERRTRAQSCMVRGPRRDRDCRGCLRSGRCEYRVRFAQHDDVRLASCGQQLLRRDHESWPSWTQDAAPARAVTGSPFSVAISLAKLPSALGGRRVQFGSQIPESESQTHASRANHSCEVPPPIDAVLCLDQAAYNEMVDHYELCEFRILTSPNADIDRRGDQ